MSRFQARRLFLGCTAGTTVVLAVRSSTAVETLASVTLEPPAPRSIAGLSAALAGLKPEPAGSASLSVTLDDSLARSFVVTPPSGARSLAELRASAAARFTALYGEAAEPWLLAADWQADAAFIACALPRELLQAIMALARRPGWRLASLSTALVRVWNRVHAAIPADGWLVVAFGLSLTLVHIRNNRVAGLRTLRLSGAPDRAELETLLAQERLRAPAEGELAVLWTGAADWLPPAATVDGLSWRVLPLPAGVAPEAGLAEECRLAQSLALLGSEE